MRSFDEHVKKFNLDDEERELLADYEANHQGKPQITKERKKELAPDAVTIKNATSKRGPYDAKRKASSADALACVFVFIVNSHVISPFGFKVYAQGTSLDRTKSKRG